MPYFKALGCRSALRWRGSVLGVAGLGIVFVFRRVEGGGVRAVSPPRLPTGALFVRLFVCLFVCLFICLFGVRLSCIRGIAEKML